MTANKFVFRHHPIEVDYTLSGTPDSPALVYRDGSSAAKTFDATEITTDQTGLGTLVWVALEKSIGTGGEKFGFFIPPSDIPVGQSREIRTVAVYEQASGPDSSLPDSVPREPSWRCIELHGTAENLTSGQ
jgi:hypothetical protein